MKSYILLVALISIALTVSAAPGVGIDSKGRTVLTKKPPPDKRSSTQPLDDPGLQPPLPPIPFHTRPPPLPDFNQAGPSRYGQEYNADHRQPSQRNSHNAGYHAPHAGYSPHGAGFPQPPNTFPPGYPPSPQGAPFYPSGNPPSHSQTPWPPPPGMPPAPPSMPFPGSPPPHFNSAENPFPEGPPSFRPLSPIAPGETRTHYIRQSLSPHPGFSRSPSSDPGRRPENDHHYTTSSSQPHSSTNNQSPV